MRRGSDYFGVGCENDGIGLNTVQRVFLLLFGPALLLYLVVAAPARAENLTFRGLNSNSTSADVMKLFPSARPESSCRNGETVSRNADGETLCRRLWLGAYPLDNMSFDMAFVFTPDGKLRYVSLIKDFGNYERDEGKIVPAEVIQSAFTSLADLLASKYGPAVSDPPRSYLRRGAADSRLEWQPGRGTKWQSGGDRISLSSHGLESKTVPRLFRGTIQIFYTFARREEFERF